MDSYCPTMDMLQPIHMQKPPGATPDGLKVTALQDPNTLQMARSCPVVSIGSFILWPFSYDDNRVSFGMVMYDPLGKVLAVKEVRGARYIWQITKNGDRTEGSVTFTGQANQSVTMSCMEIGAMMTGDSAVT